MVRSRLYNTSIATSIYVNAIVVKYRDVFVRNVLVAMQRKKICIQRNWSSLTNVIVRCKTIYSDDSGLFTDLCNSDRK